MTTYRAEGHGRKLSEQVFLPVAHLLPWNSSPASSPVELCMPRKMAHQFMTAFLHVTLPCNGSQVLIFPTWNPDVDIGIQPTAVIALATDFF